MKPGDIVYAWSTERYGDSIISRCIVEEVNGDGLYLYAIEDNRAFYRKKNEVMLWDDLEANFNKLKEEVIELRSKS